ncbi:olfactory receptor 10A2-like [Erpetoichthys calabaricus]|uniref:olfactory receptor 10A2-like n=1 Tax=Erpetoichthys calabaricus TaxID=27687 RepID=UPI0010A089BF|nr:olfactory receptor 10A2-like [Erpetoichthys calabaricus]
MSNSSSTSSDFIIVGFPGLQDYQNILFIVFLALFLVILIGNVTILLLVVADQRLHTPMYIFLWNLALLDVLVAVSIIPKLLSVFLSHNTLSFTECFVQMYFALSFGAIELFLVAAMAYDRYVAVVKPLHYNVIINFKTCLTIIASVWVMGVIVVSITVIPVTLLPYCASKYIMHCFCDYPAVISLACTDVTFYANCTFSLAMIAVYGSLLFVLWTYCRIVNAVIKLKSAESRKKAFSMCISHVIVVLMFYISCSTVYIGLKINNISYDGRIFIGGLNYFFTPMVNPIIYSLRNEQIKAAVQKYLNLYTLFHRKDKISSTVHSTAAER